MNLLPFKTKFSLSIICKSEFNLHSDSNCCTQFKWIVLRFYLQSISPLLCSQSKLYPGIAPIFGPPLWPLVAACLLLLPVASTESIRQVWKGWLPPPPPSSCQHRHNHSWFHQSSTGYVHQQDFAPVIGGSYWKSKVAVGRMEAQTEVGRCVFSPLAQHPTTQQVTHGPPLAAMPYLLVSVLLPLLTFFLVQSTFDWD